MEYEKMIELLREVNDSNLIEFELKDRDFRLKMKKESKSNENVVKTIENTSLENPVDEPQESKKEIERSKEHVITSPMVGIFHAYEGETETPYVQVGNQVEKGQIIGAVEAMKLINPLEADISGKITEILVDDGMLVEYDQPMFVVEV